ncbi:MAG: cyclic pyranopterin phosphate synthase [Oceanospirillales bacterium LUC14_002_19_P2]|nr:MAG: cyclic pyranopterin phosphate synthase [Oceanospirillales bacterium LUC14_002_19_P2]
MTVLQDRQGRTFPYLRLSVTDLCNFRCNYCLPDDCQDHHHGDALTLPEIRRLVTAFACLGTEKIRLTGGEPSLRRDFTDIIHTIKSVPDIRKVAVTTNGYKLPQRIEGWLDAGLDALNLSVDSLDPRTFQAITGHDRLQEILIGMQKAFDLGLPGAKVNAVLMRGLNDGDLDRYLDWVKAQPVSVRFIELMETGDHRAFFQQHHVSGHVIREQLEARGWTEVISLADAGPAREFCHPDYQGRIGLIMPYSPDFCRQCNRLRVSATGQLQLCLFADGGYDLRPLLQSDEDLEALIADIRRQLGFKQDGHFLEQGYTGTTRQLAQIGG